MKLSIADNKYQFIKFQVESDVAERPMVAIKGRQEFCPFSPVCHKILWTSKEITSFDVSITIPELSNIQIFSSNMEATRNSSTGRIRNKNKKEGRFDGNKDVMRAKFCIGDNKTLQSGIYYRVHVKANLMPNTSQPNFSTKATNSSLMFKIADNSTKYLLVIKKYPRDFRISSESKLKIKTRIMPCGVEGSNITSLKHPKNKTNSQRRKNKTGKENGKDMTQICMTKLMPGHQFSSARSKMSMSVKVNLPILIAELSLLEMDPCR